MRRPRPQVYRKRSLSSRARYRPPVRLTVLGSDRRWFESIFILVISSRLRHGGALRPSRGACPPEQTTKARRESTPCHLQHIADRGACGKTRVVPQNLPV